mgnify:CR=1 FL=1
MALIGPNGAGKSTLAYLLLRFADPQSEEIWIGDKPLKVYSGPEWRTVTNYLKPAVVAGYSGG